MRVGELVNIRTRNIDKENKRIMVVGKGDRSRWLTFRKNTTRRFEIDYG